MTREAYAAAARERAELLYRGEVVAHRSCGIALAETFGLPSRSYQALRKGGLLGLGPCGALQAGVLVLGELLGDPDPTGAPTPALREGVARYRAALVRSVDADPDASCNVRTSAFSDFGSPARAASCVSLAGRAAEAVAELLWDLGRVQAIPDAPER